jgi:hypothetical protein
MPAALDRKLLDEFLSIAAVKAWFVEPFLCSLTQLPPAIFVFSRIADVLIINSQLAGCARMRQGYSLDSGYAALTAHRSQAWGRY